MSFQNRRIRYPPCWRVLTSPDVIGCSRVSVRAKDVSVARSSSVNVESRSALCMLVRSSAVVQQDGFEQRYAPRPFLFPVISIATRPSAVRTTRTKPRLAPVDLQLIHILVGMCFGR